jgi:hypothetical protein
MPVFLGMLGSVAVVSASFDVDGTENLNERYVFYVVPLTFVGLALWIEEGLPRRRPWALLVVLACLALTVALPVDRLHYNSGFQSLALVPWIVLSLRGVALAAVVGLFTLACGALWLTCRRERAGRLWLLVAVWMSIVGLLTIGSNDTSAQNAAGIFGGNRPTWVDDAVPANTSVPVVWDQNLAVKGAPDALYYWVMATEFFNPTVGQVYRLGPSTYYEGFLPTVPARLGPGGVVLDPSGDKVDAGYVLVSCRTAVPGKVVARSPGGLLRVVEVDGPVRIEGRRPTCFGDRR